MWHASVSLQDRRRGALDRPDYVERVAVETLEGVGGGREWWYWSPGRVGHLRVALTDAEAAAVPPWCGPVDDAGESGPERPRTLRA